MKKTIYDKKDIRNYVKALSLIKSKRWRNLCILQKKPVKTSKTPKYDSVREEAHEEIYQMQRQLAELHKLQNGMAVS